MAWRILIADDSPNMRSALGAIFRAQDGWVVCGMAADGQEAVELTQKLKPDAVLLDFQMPEKNGLEAAAQILKGNSFLPVILYSLHEISMLEKQARAVGVAKIISKDNIFNSLISSLQELLPPARVAPSRPPDEAPIGPDSQRLSDKRTRKKDAPEV